MWNAIIIFGLLFYAIRSLFYSSVKVMILSWVVLLSLIFMLSCPGERLWENRIGNVYYETHPNPAGLADYRKSRRGSDLWEYRKSGMSGKINAGVYVKVKSYIIFTVAYASCDGYSYKYLGWGLVYADITQEGEEYLRALPYCD